MEVVTILMMSAKMATLGLLKQKLFENKGYDVIIFIHDVTNKLLLRESNGVMWVRFGISRISMKEVIITSIDKNLTRKTTFFE